MTAVAAAFALWANAVATGIPTLTTLQKGCAIEREWLGLVPALPAGLWLRCGESGVLLAHPRNLIGKVNIETAEEALEFVRYFSSPDTYAFFELGGMVELVSSRSARAAKGQRFNIVEHDLFERHLTSAVARFAGDLEWTGEGESARVCRRCRSFEITRSVIFPDQRVYEITETVFQNGFYSLAEKRLICSGQEIGIYFIGGI
jgi:hypothetical protein